MNVPKHVAIIMDGNGRWAKGKGLPRVYGHKKGLDVAEKIIDYSLSLGVEYLSLYVFSTENWKRPVKEINSLFALADKYLSRLESFCKDRVRVVVSGEREGLPQSLIDKIDAVKEKTKNFDKICVNLCINYGGQNEIAEAVKKVNAQHLAVTVENIRANLYNSFIPQPDLIVRTGGQKRLSNFLLFESAYAELYFTDTFWPDFSCEEYNSILEDYNRRTRNFGGIVDD
ncbi:MAG: polyprenyl diphosphate synthase [Corallococcus sp.]|nr:polyprenyl diphosphate synthase [Bacillota bacterium]MCM1534129.1 polyprenyl diphosphate synthase [Corallococcus sp.]